MLRPLALTAVAVLLGAVAACGGGPTTDAASTQQYCNTLEDTQKEFSALQRGDIAGIDTKLFDRLHTLADQAPPAVADEWQKLDAGFTQLEGGLDQVGVGLTDLSDPAKLQDLGAQKLKKLQKELQEFGGRNLEQAGNTIEKHAQKECGIKLGQK